MQFKSEFLHTLNERGFLNNCSSYEELDKLMASSSVSAYIGFDCTAPSLHAGSLMQILIFKYLQKFGHKPVIILGGGTSVVGDPSFKDEARQLLTIEKIQENLLGIKSVFENFISFEGKNGALMVNNYDWLSQLNYLEFLRDFGVHFTVNRMLSFESVKLRLDREQPLSFLEFNYMLLQAIDFYHLKEHHDVSLQIGGSDQWGNILNGVELIRRKTGKAAFGLTTNLITKADGTKMGKTATGAIWLTKSMCSVWDFYQYFRNTHDDNVIEYLKIFTEVSLDEINKLAQLKGKELNEAKKILAYELTKLCHGKEEADKCTQTAINTFEENIIDENLPTIEIKMNELSNIEPISKLLTTHNLQPSNSSSRTIISQGGIKINDVVCEDPMYIINKNDFTNNILKLNIGKKQIILFKLV